MGKTLIKMIKLILYKQEIFFNYKIKFKLNSEVKMKLNSCLQIVKNKDNLIYIISKYIGNKNILIHSI